ncbi:MAG: MATE family efflux transporter [Dethiobacteria bacterium]
MREGSSGLASSPEVTERIVQTTNLKRTVLTIAGPAVLRTFLNMVVQMVDMIMIGGLGAAAVAAVGVSNQFFFLTVSAVQAFSMGATTLVAQNIGAGEVERAKTVARQALVGTILITFLFSIFIFAFTEQMIKLMLLAMEELDQEVLGLSTSYLRIISTSIMFRFTMIAINGIFQGAGDSRTPLYFMILTNLLNVIGNYLLIFGIGFFPALGVQGAAIATAASGIIGGTVAFILLFTKYSPLPLSMRDDFRFDFTILRRIFKIGVPAALEQVSIQGSQIVYTMIVASLGTLAIAAHQILHLTFIITHLPGIGFAVAANALVGQFLGAEKRQWAFESAMLTLRYALFIMLGAGICYLFVPELVLSLFTREAKVIALARFSLVLLAFAQPGIAVISALGGGLRGAGDTRWIMLLTFLNMFGLRLAITLLLVLLGFGLNGVWLAMLLEILIRAALIYRRFLIRIWDVERLSG